MSDYNVSLFNLEQLAKQARGLWQNLDQLADSVKRHKEAKCGINVEDEHHQAFIENKMVEVQILIRAASGAMNELCSQIFSVLRKGEPMSDDRINQIYSSLQMVGRAGRHGEEEWTVKTCRELLAEIHRLRPCPERYTGDDLIPRKK